jgi:predicted dehydrogenase
MSERKINVGIVGLGFMAATHIKAYRQIPQARITAICNPSGRNLNGDLRTVGGNIGANDPVQLDMTDVRPTREFSELLDDSSIELIDVCSPTICHSEHVISALRAGKHVICEKPLARTAELAREIVAASKEAKTFSMPAMCLRFWPEWAWLKNAITSGTYGRALSARFRRVAEAPTWGTKHFASGKHSGGALLDLHIHDVDFVQHCFGKPQAVFASGYTKYSGAIDHVVAQYQVTSGAIVSAEGSWAMSPGFGFSMAYTVNFEHATVDYDLARPVGEVLKLWQPGPTVEFVKCEGPDGYIGELNYILDCILGGRPPQVVTMEDGLQAVAICEAEERSIQSGAVVII